MLFPTAPIVIVDDEPAALTGAELVLEADGITHLVPISDSREVMPLLESREVGAVLLDLSMPHLSGERLLKMIHERMPELPVLILTGHNEIETAIRCMKQGAFDYLVKPVHATRLSTAVRRAVEMGELRNEYASFKDKVLSNRLAAPEAFSHIITKNAKMMSLFQYVETIAPSSRAALITGETGVGKELMVKAIHDLSGRRGPLIAVNVASLDDNVFSDTLFGHVRGAFTGADHPRKGLVEQAAAGTLFLDEIGELEMGSQVKLLRLLQENEYYPLGADAAKPAAARIIVATNRSLQGLQTEGRFRSDLYYRLKTHHINIPPLRERLDDIPLLVDHFIKRAAADLERRPPTPPRELYQLLAAYRFPGNVRELEAMVFDAVSQHQAKVLSMQAFRTHIHGQTDPRAADPVALSEAQPLCPFATWDRLPTLTDSQVLLIEEALRRTKGNQTQAADMLGITRSGLSKAIKRKSIGRP